MNHPRRELSLIEQPVEGSAVVKPSGKAKHWYHYHATRKNRNLHLWRDRLPWIVMCAGLGLLLVSLASAIVYLATK